MTALATLLWGLEFVFSTAEHLAFKAAATAATGEHGLARWIAMAKNVWIWVGVTVFVAQVLSWLAFLSLVPLSLAVLVGSVDILAVSIGGRIFFGEALTPRRVLSAVLITVGVALAGWGG